MTWREELRRVDFDGRSFIGASFRGVPFFVSSSERSGGRRVVVHSFPQRDEPYAEDLGRNTLSFSLDAYVIGDNYLSQKNALLNALEGTAGPGQLIHPYYGIVVAICSSLSVRETDIEGGIARFAIKFEEAPAQGIAPTIDQNPVAQISASADLAIAGSRLELIQNYSSSGLPSFALSSAEIAIKSAATSLQARLLPVIQSTQEAASLSGRIQVMTATASSLARSPGTAFDSFREAITSLVDSIESVPSEILSSLLEAYGDDLGTIATGTTFTRQREIINQQSIIAAIQRILCIESARILPSVSFSTVQDATVARDRSASDLQEQASIAYDTSYPFLVSLRSEVLRSVPRSDLRSRLTTVTRPNPIPSILLSYQLYGSVDKEIEIIERNKGAIRHPGSISGTLLVLSNDR